jgi:hypothetical protein
MEMTNRTLTKGMKAMFHSKLYPTLAPYVVTINAVNYSMSGETAPYYNFKSELGTVSQWFYFESFTLIQEPNEQSA